MWFRALIVGSLALSQRLPVSKTSLAAAVDSSSSTNDPSSESGPKTVRSTSPVSSFSPSYRDGELPAPRESSWKLVQATSPAFSFEKYHLLWSPHAWKKTLGTILVLVILPRFNLSAPSIIATKLRGLSLSTPGSLYQNLVLPLAASACCMLQLGLNLLSVGCAGWNSYLGPVRPYFLGILLMANIRHRPAASTLLWRSSVALLPEIVFLYNTWQQTSQKRNAETMQQLDLQEGMEQFVMELDIPTMGCVACINAIDARLRRIPGVVQVSSALKPLGATGGSAQVVVSTNDATAMTNSIIEVVADAGFDGATLTSMRTITGSATCETD